MYIHNTNTNIKILVNDKIGLLHDFTILKEKYIKQEVETYLLLGTCQSEIQMEQKLYNVLHGNETLKDLLERDKMKVAHEGVEILSQLVAEFLCEFQYNNPEELTKEIIKQLKDFTTLRQTVLTFYNLNLEDEDRFDTLENILIKREELKCIN